MNIIMAVIVGILSGSAALAVAFFIKRKANYGIGQERKDLKISLAGIDQDLLSLTKESEKLISRRQLEGIRKRRLTLSQEMDTAKNLAIEIEEKVRAAQKAIKEKESSQSKLKAVKVGEENKIAEIITTYEALNGESIDLERKLAESMKQLDSLEGEAQLTEKQKEALAKLSEVLSSAGERMRELITEYDTINKRILELQQQYLDLEDEFKRLVEQQLSS
jgi:chromosome segregation ATPase